MLGVEIAVFAHICDDYRPADAGPNHVADVRGLDRARELLAVLPDEQLARIVTAGQTAAAAATDELNARTRRRAAKLASSTFTTRTRRWMTRTPVTRTLMALEDPDEITALLKRMAYARYRADMAGQNPPSDAVMRFEVLPGDVDFVKPKDTVMVVVTLTWEEAVPA